MKHLQKNLLALLLLILLPGAIASAQEALHRLASKDQAVTFHFRPGQDLFVRAGNEVELERLYHWIDLYRAEIAEGRLPICVDGYCASLATRKENLNLAYLRASRVKSELITQKGLKESHFITANYPHAYDNSSRDIVVVTFRIPAKTEIAAKPKELMQEQTPPVVKQEPETAVQEEPAQVVESLSGTAAQSKPYCLALRTNLLYDAMLLPTLGVEWRINRDLGIKLDGSLSWWSNEHGKVQKMWLLNPEVRWYLLDKKRFYVGASGSYSKYNIYEFPLGKMLTDDTGYQGKLWNAGLTVGYQLFLSRSFSIDFNLGLGYTHSDYDSFQQIDGVRVYKQKDRSKNIWGPTQAGISLVWTIGSNK